MTSLNPYKLQIGEKIRVTIPPQYKIDNMFIEGVKTELKTYTTEKVISGTFEGIPKATSGFFFKTTKPCDGGLYLIDISEELSPMVNLNDMIATKRK